MKSSVVAITALLLASSAHAQVQSPPLGSPGEPQPPASSSAATASSPAPAVASSADTPTTPAPSPAGELSAQQAAPNQVAAVPDSSAMLIAPPVPLASPGPGAAAAPLGTKPTAAPDSPRPPAAGPMKIELPNATIKFGFLLQPQYEAVGHPTLDSATNNIYLRRTRIIIGATLFKNFEIFVETDFPNLMRAANNTQGEVNNKATAGMNIQDAFATAKALGDALRIDIGYMLPAGAHNALQGATTLYSWDYFTNSFRHSNVFHSGADPVGRDAGIQLRGLLLNNILEYRVGMFQGKRENVTTTEVAGQNMFRGAGRVQINLLDPETGFFYAGSYLGTKRVLSFGVAYDWQSEYHHSSGDGFLDMPVGPGVLTAQADVSHWNGGTWVSLPRQTAFMSEAGYLINAINLSPIARYEQRWVDQQTSAATDEIRVGGGVAFWPYGHNINVKAFYTRVRPTPSLHDYNQVNVQAQLYVF